MGNAFHTHDYTLSAEEVKVIKKETGFSEAQVKRLFRRFHHLDKGGKGYLTKEELLHIKEVIHFYLVLLVVTVLLVSKTKLGHFLEIRSVINI